MSKVLKNLLNNIIHQKENVNLTKTEINKPLDILGFVEYFKTRLGNAPENYMYSTFDSPLDEKTLEQLTDFINLNYHKKSDYYKLTYSKELLDYYTSTNCITTFLYQKDNPDKIVGCLIGKNIEVEVNENIEFTQHHLLEANFLCIVPELRSINLTNYLNYIITTEFVKRWNVCSAYFTGTKQLRWVTPFSSKKIYFRPINYNKLIDTGFLSQNYNKTKLKKLYNSFSYQISFQKKHTLLYLNKDVEIDDDFVNIIHEKLYNYQRDNHFLFQVHSHNDIKNMLTNPRFHNFIFLDKENNNEIVYFVNFYELDFYYDNVSFMFHPKTNFKNIYLYSCFFKNKENVNNVLELIHKYLYENNITDLTNIFDIFGYSDKDFYNMKLLKNANKIYYYTVNFEIPEIQSRFNSMITI